MVKFDADAVAVLRDEASRDFLIDTGLPDSHLLFTAALPETRMIRYGAGPAKELLVIGSSDPLASFGIDIVTGSVNLVHSQDLSVLHVNSSVLRFAKCLERFAEGCPFGSANAELELLEHLAEAFGRELTAIDPSALEEDPGFWNDILFDIANSDYAADQFR